MTTPYGRRRVAQKLEVISRQEFDLFRTRIAREIETLKFEGELRGLPDSLKEMKLEEMKLEDKEIKNLPHHKDDKQEHNFDEIKDSNEC
jgi:hypothetical protein